MTAIPGDYARAQRLGHVVGELLVETMGGIGPALLEVLQGAAESRANKLTHGEYEMEAAWSTRRYMPFVMQRISVAVQIAAATEIRQAMGVGLGPSAALPLAGGRLAGWGACGSRGWVFGVCGLLACRVCGFGPAGAVRRAWARACRCLAVSPGKFFFWSVIEHF